MTNEQSGLSGVDNLTPFEYALAGVIPTGTQDSPSLQVVEQMRALAAEVQDAPITQERLQELMGGTPSLARRSERRALRRRRAMSAGGGFVDITPIELTEQNGQAAGNGSVTGEPAASTGFDPGLDADGRLDLPNPAFAEPDPTSEQPAIGLAAAAAGAVDELAVGELDVGEFPLNGHTDDPTAADPTIDHQIAAALTDTGAADEIDGDLLEDTVLLDPATMFDETGFGETAFDEATFDEARFDESRIDEASAPQHHGLSPEDADVVGYDVPVADSAGPFGEAAPFDEQRSLDGDDPLDGYGLPGDDPLDGYGLPGDGIPAEAPIDEEPDPIDPALVGDPEGYHLDAAAGAAAGAGLLFGAGLLDETDQPGDHGSLQHLGYEDDVLADQEYPDLDGDRPLETAGEDVDEDTLFVDFDQPPPVGSERFVGEQLFDEEPAPFDPEEPLVSDEDDIGTPVLVAAGNNGILPDDAEDEEGRPLAVAALTGVVPAPGPERRFGTAFWALAGTATAAAVLALGGLLWANSLNDGGTMESAATTDGSAVEDADQVDAGGPEASESDDGGASGATAGSLTDDPATDEATSDGERPALSVDGEEDPATTDPENDSAPGTTAAGDGDGTGDNGSAAGTDDGTGTDGTTGSGTGTDGGDPDEGSTPTTAAAVTSTTAEPTTVPPTTKPPATEAPTTLPPATEAPTTTTTIPTTTTAVTQPPATVRPTFIGDRVTLGGYNGPGRGGVTVRLFRDEDRNGTGDRSVATTVTNNSGFYAFDGFEAGCYETRFSQSEPGLELAEDMASQSFCIEAGDQYGRVDAIVSVQPPDGCQVENDTGRWDAGVEVYEDDFVLADSYVFYNQQGGVVFRTASTGGPDDLDPGNTSTGDYEWFAEQNGFNLRSVRSVAAVKFGVESAPLTCQR